MRSSHSTAEAGSAISPRSTPINKSAVSTVLLGGLTYAAMHIVEGWSAFDSPRDIALSLLFVLFPNDVRRTEAQWAISTVAWALLAWVLWTSFRSLAARVLASGAIFVFALLTPALLRRGKPSRKSTRKSSNRAKQAETKYPTTIMKTRSPSARAARGQQARSRGRK